jgi:FdhD protein
MLNQKRANFGLPFFDSGLEAGHGIESSMGPPPPVSKVSVIAWRGQPSQTDRMVPEEVAVAMTYDRVTFAVMMASPLDLHDFAVGFSLSEGIIENPADITEFELAVLPLGLECRMALTPARREALEGRRRRIAGPVGCGLCGIDSLTEAVRPSARVKASLSLPAQEIMLALARLPKLQHLNAETRAVHGAAFYTPADGALLVREDVGRHNALDKLIGAVRRRGDTGGQGVVLLTSRVSIELIQKTAALGASILVAVSVPSARAVRDAQIAGITLIAVARDDGFEIFTHPERII